MNEEVENDNKSDAISNKAESERSNKFVRKNSKDKISLDRESLEKLSQNELIEEIVRLDSHNKQLKNILHQKTDNVEKLKKKAQKKFNFDAVSKRHVLLKFYYLGWDNQGFATQENSTNTIEYHAFSALEQCCLIKDRESSNYHRCGRTDKGVSSFSQVISIDLRSKLDSPTPDNVNEELPYCTMINRLLPDNIKCYAWSHVGPKVSARFDCCSRTYKYFFPKGNIDIPRMEEGAKYMVGTHDFRNLCKMDVCNGVVEFRRTINFVEIRLCPSSSKETSGYQMYELIIQAKGFLWHQIRCIMTVLILIGEGKESPTVVKELLDVETHPKKPQYHLANEIPLNLFYTNFDSVDLNWKYDQNELKYIIKLLQSQWTNYTVKGTMIREMLDELETLKGDSDPVTEQASCLLSDNKTKIYKPLLTRMTCDSLETKIEHYVKRRKLILEEKS